MAKRNLYVLTLEPIEKRYTKQWYEYWKKEFSKKFNVHYIDGKLSFDNIKKGKFLDINRTNIWKAQQVIEIAKLFDKEKIKNGDRFILMDGWHFATTAIKYMAQLNNIKIKIYSYWHAGTWDDNDFVTQAGLRSWANHIELGWMYACDGHFVATKYHKKIINEYFEDCGLSPKIYVVGFPMDWKKETKKHRMNINNKKDLIVFPHRIDPEKQPEVFDRISKSLKKYNFIKTIEVTDTKEQYYDILKSAKIIFSANKQETYGIGTVEAVMLGCIPVVPNRLTYVEMYPKEFRYTDISEAKRKIKHYIETYDFPLLQKKIKKLQEKLNKDSKDAIKRMSRVMSK